MTPAKSGDNFDNGHGTPCPYDDTGRQATSSTRGHETAGYNPALHTAKSRERRAHAVRPCDTIYDPLPYPSPVGGGEHDTTLVGKPPVAQPNASTLSPAPPPSGEGNMTQHWWTSHQWHKSTRNGGIRSRPTNDVPRGPRRALLTEGGAPRRARSLKTSPAPTSTLTGAIPTHRDAPLRHCWASQQCHTT